MENEFIKLFHGSGGQLTDKIIEKLFVNRVRLHNVFGGIGLKDLDDGASIPMGDFEFIITSDGYTVDPIFFPGGDIGMLAVCGTINDLAVMGAKPIAIMDNLIVEEGFPIFDLERIVDSMIKVASENNVAIIGGDFKVMPKGKLDKIVIGMCGIGVVHKGRVITDYGVKCGDKIIVTGTIGDHEIALMSVREGLSFIGNIKSDVAPIYNVIESALNVGGIHAAKDPTRGGLAGVLNVWAKKNNVEIYIQESEIPLKPEVKVVCEMMGLDPLYLACEGRAVLSVDPIMADEVLNKIRSLNGCESANIIGEVRESHPGYVVMETVVGGMRVIPPPVGSQLPRIC
ncbi:MAG: hydrogenase expression/formation protein HypE [Candidatus Methanomethylicia archaeon]